MQKYLICINFDIFLKKIYGNRIKIIFYKKLNCKDFFFKILQKNIY